MTQTKDLLLESINRIMYGLLVALSVYYFVLAGDLEMCMSNLGIALIFDPFKQEVTWNNRPLYQRIWLIAHVICVLALLGFIIIY